MAIGNRTGKLSDKCILVSNFGISWQNSKFHLDTKRCSHLLAKLTQPKPNLKPLLQISSKRIEDINESQKRGKHRCQSKSQFRKFQNHSKVKDTSFCFLKKEKKKGEKMEETKLGAAVKKKKKKK